MRRLRVFRTQAKDGPSIHPRAICESKRIGRGTRIWAFSHVLPFAVIGEDCNICENVFIENNVKVGSNVTIKNAVQLWDGISIENDVFIGPNVTFCNDKYPRGGNRNFDLLPTTIKQGVSIGANATILPGIQIGQFAIVGAGSVVTKDVYDFQVVAGNPAKQI